MLIFVVFFVGVILGFFDFFYLIFLFLFLLLVFLKDWGVFYFGGVIFVDSLRFFIVFLCLYLFCFCAFCSFIEDFNSNNRGFFYTYLKGYWQALRAKEKWDFNSRMEAYLEIPHEVEARICAAKWWRIYRTCCLSAHSR